MHPHTHARTHAHAHTLSLSHTHAHTSPLHERPVCPPTQLASVPCAGHPAVRSAPGRGRPGASGWQDGSFSPPSFLSLALSLCVCMGVCVLPLPTLSFFRAPRSAPLRPVIRSSATTTPLGTAPTGVIHRTVTLAARSPVLDRGPSRCSSASGSTRDCWFVSLFFLPGSCA